MAADADGALVMQPGLTAGAAARVMQDAALVAENGIGDDLLVGGVVSAASRSMKEETPGFMNAFR